MASALRVMALCGVPNTTCIWAGTCKKTIRNLTNQPGKPEGQCGHTHTRVHIQIQKHIYICIGEHERLKLRKERGGNGKGKKEQTSTGSAPRQFSFNVENPCFSKPFNNPAQRAELCVDGWGADHVHPWGTCFIPGTWCAMPRWSWHCSLSPTSPSFRDIVIQV
jgi:hypothetical protein